MSMRVGALKVSRVGANANSREKVSMATLEAGPLTDTVTLNKFSGDTYP